MWFFVFIHHLVVATQVPVSTEALQSIRPVAARVAVRQDLDLNTPPNVD